MHRVKKRHVSFIGIRHAGAHVACDACDTPKNDAEMRRSQLSLSLIYDNYDNVIVIVIFSPIYKYNLYIIVQSTARQTI
jgi:hypothetical protein